MTVRDVTKGGRGKRSVTRATKRAAKKGSPTPTLRFSDAVRSRLLQSRSGVALDPTRRALIAEIDDCLTQFDSEALVVVLRAMSQAVGQSLPRVPRPPTSPRNSA